MSIFGGKKSAAQTPTKALGIDFQSSQYGPPIPVVFGQNKLSGNCIWYGDFTAKAVKQSSGGKGGGGSTTSYNYSASFELGLCEGPATVVTVYDGSSTVSLSASGGVAFTGGIGQAPWAHLSGDAALGYSGTALAAFQNLALGSDASLPNYNFEMAGRNQFGSGILDANPADILTAICTDTQIGIQFGALGDLSQFKAYCTAAGIFFSPVYDTQNPAQQALDDLFKYANSVCFFSEGVLKVVPYADVVVTGNGVTFTPNVTAIADLGRNDFITNGATDPVTIARVGPADAMNIQRVEFTDRSNTYHTSGVVASIDQDVVATGARADQDDSVDMITTAAVARMVAQNLLQRTYYIRNTYTFQLSWRYCYLEPMDVVTLTDANTGLYLAPVRITEVAEDEHGLLSITAEEFPEGVSHASTYETQPNAGTSVDPNVDPGAIDGPYLFRGPGFLVSNQTPEIWAAISSNNTLWGGCDIFISQDGTSYTYLVTSTKLASYGELTNTLAVKADPDTTSAPNVVLNGAVQLLGGSKADADNFVTLAMVDTEIISYETATLASGPSYTLGYLRRGGYGSAIAAHTAGAPFVRLDENIVRIPVDPSQIGQTVYLKFRSFNVFGKGGRTLAEETAYTYVVGTNVELPDIPLTPSSFAILSVADGVNLTWVNANPAAVGCTSIEYSTTGTSGWTVLAQVGPTTTSYHHSFTSGATYYYRARSRGPLVSGGWSAYTAVLSTAGVNVSAISANAATGAANTPSVINPQFITNTTGWSFDTSGTGEWYRESGANSPDSAISTYLVHLGVSGQASTVARNQGHVAVVPGQSVTAACCLKSVSANAGSQCYARITWRDSNYSELSNTIATVTCGPGGTYLQCVSRAVGNAPANAQFANFEVAYIGHTSGHYTMTSANLGTQPASLDEVQDSTTYSRTVSQSVEQTVDNAGFELPIDSSGNVPGWGVYESATVGVSTVHYVGSQSLVATATSASATYWGAVCNRRYACTVGDSVNASAAVLCASGQNASLYVLFYNAAGTQVSAASAAATPGSWQSLSFNATVPSGAACFAIGLVSPSAWPVGSQIYMDQVRVAVNDLRVVGSGAQIGDQRNLPAVNFGNFGSGWTGLTFSYSSTSSSATVSASAATLVAGSVSIAYSASSITLSGTPGTVVYYLYYLDPTMSGGSKTLNASTSQITALSNNGAVYLGSVSITFPSSGGGSGGGSGGCPLREAWVIRRNRRGGRQFIRAGAVRVGDYLLLHDEAWGEVTYSKPTRVPCVRLIAYGAGTLGCSRTAPILTDDGDILAPECTGKIAPVWAPSRRATTITDVADLGERWVQHITCQNAHFLTGDSKDCLFAHHNLKPENQ